MNFIILVVASRSYFLFDMFSVLNVRTEPTIQLFEPLYISKTDSANLNCLLDLLMQLRHHLDELVKLWILYLFLKHFFDVKYILVVSQLLIIPHDLHHRKWWRMNLKGQILLALAETGSSVSRYSSDSIRITGSYELQVFR